MDEGILTILQMLLNISLCKLKASSGFLEKCLPELGVHSALSVFAKVVGMSAVSSVISGAAELGR